MMAEIKRKNPNGLERFEIRAELSHVNLLVSQRSYAGITIIREIFQPTPYKWFDPSTWSGGRWIRSDNPRTILERVTFLDAPGNDISSGIGPMGETNNPGYYELFSVFYNLGAEPANLGNDARSVKKVVFKYRFPWENSSRTLQQA
jgi:hypothetical protein